MSLLNLANTAYNSTGILDLATYYHSETGEFNVDGHGDTLAEFIVREVTETFDETSSRLNQLQTAIGAMYSAESNLRSVRAALEDVVVEDFGF